MLSGVWLTELLLLYPVHPCCGGCRAADGDPNVIFKDLDVDMRIVLEQSAHEALMQQLAADSDLLK
jgi:hypothetical protein